MQIIVISVLPQGLNAQSVLFFIVDLREKCKHAKCELELSLKNYELFFQTNHNILFKYCNSFHSIQMFRNDIAIIDCTPVLARLLSVSDWRIPGSDQIADRTKKSPDPEIRL